MKNKFKNKNISSLWKRWFFTINHKRIGIMYMIFGVFNGFLSILLLGLSIVELSSPGSVTVVLIWILTLVFLLFNLFFFVIHIFFFNSYVYIKELVSYYVVVNDLKVCRNIVYRRVPKSKHTYRAVKWFTELELEIINFYPYHSGLLYSDLRKSLLYISQNNVLDNYEADIFSMIEYEDFLLDLESGYIFSKNIENKEASRCLQYFDFNSSDFDFINTDYSVDCYISILLSYKVGGYVRSIYGGKFQVDTVEQEEVFLFLKELGTVIRNMDCCGEYRLDVYGFTKLNSGKSFLYEFVIRELYHNFLVSKVNNNFFRYTNFSDTYIFVTSKDCNSYLNSRELQSRASFAKLKLENPLLNYISYDDLIKNLPLFVYSVIIAANSRDVIDWCYDMEDAKSNIKEDIRGNTWK